jgi:hypothetical protein
VNNSLAKNNLQKQRLVRSLMDGMAAAAKDDQMHRFHVDYAWMDA